MTDPDALAVELQHSHDHGEILFATGVHVCLGELSFPHEATDCQGEGHADPSIPVAFLSMTAADAPSLSSVLLDNVDIADVPLRNFRLAITGSMVRGLVRDLLAFLPDLPDDDFTEFIPVSD